MNASPRIDDGGGEETSSVFLSPKRLSVTLPDSVMKKLSKKSLREGRSLSNLAAFLVEQSLASDSQDLKQCSALLVNEEEISAPVAVPD